MHFNVARRGVAINFCFPAGGSCFNCPYNIIKNFPRSHVFYKLNLYVFALSCVCYVLCASVYMCFVATCWERADLLALVCGVFCEFVTFPLVSWVRCGT